MYQLETRFARIMFMFRLDRPCASVTCGAKRYHVPIPRTRYSSIMLSLLARFVASAPRADPCISIVNVAILRSDCAEIDITPAQAVAAAAGAAAAAAAISSNSAKAVVITSSSGSSTASNRSSCSDIIAVRQNPEGSSSARPVLPWVYTAINCCVCSLTTAVRTSTALDGRWEVGWAGERVDYG